MDVEIKRCHVDESRYDAKAAPEMIVYVDDPACNCGSYDTEHVLVVTGITENELRSRLALAEKVLHDHGDPAIL